MLPITQIPASILTNLQDYRHLFCRDAGFDHIGRYITGLIVSPNKTLQGIHDLQVCLNNKKVSSRAMHEAVFEAGWKSDQLMPYHRERVSRQYKGKKKHVISIDWTHSHHARGSHIFGVKKGYDYVKGGYGLFQTILTATVADTQRVDGLEVEIQQPAQLSKEKAYLKATAKKEYENLEAARERLQELLHYRMHCKAYRKITEIAVDVVQQIEEEGHFPEADYAFDNGVLTIHLTRLIEEKGKRWTSELEKSRHINWKGQWCRIDEVANELKEQHPQAFRRIKYQTRAGENRVCWGFSKSLRLKRYGKKRILIVHEKEDLSDTPRFLVTNALHWEGKRILTNWSYRWPCELFHEFSKQNAGFEASQVRKEEAVKRHFRLSCVAQTLLQDMTISASTSEKFDFANGKITYGQRVRKVYREVLSSLLSFAQQAFNLGQSETQILNKLIPV